MKERILFERDGNLVGVALIDSGRITVNVRMGMGLTDIKEVYEMTQYLDLIKTYITIAAKNEGIIPWEKGEFHFDEDKIVKED